jgi:pimeloyl-ACP methyl ester carboxylesterase
MGPIRVDKLIVGTRDLLTPVWHARCTAGHLPVAELHILPAAATW